MAGPLSRLLNVGGPRLGRWASYAFASRFDSCTRNQHRESQVGCVAMPPHRMEHTDEALAGPTGFRAAQRFGRHNLPVPLQTPLPE